MATNLALAEKKRQEEGKALIDRAKQLSDIRTNGLPAFRMLVNFRIIKKDQTTTGTYSETWVSPEKWRSETIVGDSRHVMVVNGDKRWVSGTLPTMGVGMAELGFRMDNPRFAPDFWKVGKIEDRKFDPGSVRCVESEPNGLGARSSLCLDKATGLVSALVQPVPLADKWVDGICTYSDYQKFGEKQFPRVTRCFEAREPIFEGVLVALTTETSPEPTLFAPLADGKESANCRGTLIPPKAIHSADPVLPRRENRTVALWLKVGEDGIPKDLTVVRSVDSAFDKAALDAVRRWRFRPASCDGRPMETQLSVQVDFRAY